jgi:hypothetical protein
MKRAPTRDREANKRVAYGDTDWPGASGGAHTARAARDHPTVTDVNFNPCTGFPFCGFFGDYTQLVSGPDGIIHAAWSDTRDGASMQIWSQAITW